MRNNDDANRESFNEEESITSFLIGFGLKTDPTKDKDSEDKKNRNDLKPVHKQHQVGQTENDVSVFDV